MSVKKGKRKDVCHNQRRWEHPKQGFEKQKHRHILTTADKMHRNNTKGREITWPFRKNPPPAYLLSARFSRWNWARKAIFLGNCGYFTKTNKFKVSSDQE